MQTAAVSRAKLPVHRMSDVVCDGWDWRWWVRVKRRGSKGGATHCHMSSNLFTWSGIYLPWVLQPAQAQLAPQEQESPHILSDVCVFENETFEFC